MTTYVSAELRRLVAERADHLCEYCLISEDDTFLGCQVDHIISEKHGGPTEADNLSFACTFCNRAKGTDVGSIAVSSGEFTRFYNPRTDKWFQHFEVDDLFILAITPIGEATVKILDFNAPERILERELLRAIGRYPPARALKHLRERTSGNS